MGRRPILSDEEVAGIKIALWSGKSQGDIATEYELSQGTISNIRTGRAYPHVAWPDGSTGAITEHRRTSMANNRRRDSITRKIQYNIDSKILINEEAYKRLFPERWEEIMNMGFSGVNAYADHLQAKMDREDFERRQREPYEKLEPDPTPEEQARRHAAALEADKTRPDPYNDPIDPYKQEMRDWDWVLAAAPDHPLVQMADIEDDEPLRLSIRIIFKMLSSTYWNQPETTKNILQTKNRIISQGN